MSTPQPAPLPPWGSAVAGATGAVIANAMVYPLDMVKTRMQAQPKRKHGKHGHATEEGKEYYTSSVDAIRKIVAADGVGGLYAGMAGSLLGVASTNFAYFYWYSVVRTVYTKYQKTPGSPGTAVELSLGAAAGALAQLFTIPVAVIATQQQMQTGAEKKGFFETGREVINGEDGYSGLWAGLKASLVLVVNPAITYGAYQRLREYMYPGRLSLRPAEAFLLGAISKTLATIVTQPLIVSKVGLQTKTHKKRDGTHAKSFLDVMASIVENEGLAGLFKGIAPQIAKGLLVQGLLMMTKERMELLFVMLFAYIRMVRKEQLKKAADAIKAQADTATEAIKAQADTAADAIRSQVSPMAEQVVEKAKEILPATMK